MKYFIKKSNRFRESYCVRLGKLETISGEKNLLATDIEFLRFENDDLFVSSDFKKWRFKDEENNHLDDSMRVKEQDVFEFESDNDALLFYEVM